MRTCVLHANHFLGNQGSKACKQADFHIVTLRKRVTDLDLSATERKIDMS